MHLPGSRDPVHAAQPIIGGMAPTREPTQVFIMLIRFRGVYANVYKARLNAPNPATIGFTPLYKRHSPVVLDKTANPTPCNGLKIEKHFCTSTF